MLRIGLPPVLSAYATLFSRPTPCHPRLRLLCRLTLVP
jgi:hypothetical protein